MAIIYLDEASHCDPGQPFNRLWNRAIHARLPNRLTADGARAAIFDIVFSDPGPNPEADVVLAEAMRRNKRVVLAANRSDNQPASDSGTWSR